MRKYLSISLFFLFMVVVSLQASNLTQYENIRNKDNILNNSLEKGSSWNCVLIGYYLGSSYNSIYVKDTLAYSAARNDGLRIIDVSNPQYPMEIGHYDATAAYDVYVKDTLAYVSGDGLHIINVSNPTSPTEIGFYDTENYVNRIYVKDTIAYLAADLNGLRLINVSNPANPVEIGYCFSYYGLTYDVNVIDTLAYVADNQGGLRIIDVSNPQNPVEIGYYNTFDPDSDACCAHRVFVKDTLAYVTYALLMGTKRDNGTFRIINVSNPQSPVEIGYLPYCDDALGVYVEDTLAYVCYYSKLSIIDVSNPQSPVEIGYYYPSNNYDVFDVYVKDKLAYITGGTGGNLYIIKYKEGSSGIKSRTKNNEDNIKVGIENSSINILYSIKTNKNVNINIYNITGQKLYCNNSIKSPGQYSVRWNGNTGIYFVNIDIDKYRYTKKVIIIK
mgnify:CR=1 FL=1